MTQLALPFPTCTEFQCSLAYLPANTSSVTSLSHMVDLFEFIEVSGLRPEVLAAYSQLAPKWTQ